MKSKIFLCLLLIVTMFAFVACSNNGDGDTGMLRNGIDDVENGMDLSLIHIWKCQMMILNHRRRSGNIHINGRSGILGQ